ncbi:hypothetical protein OXYTRIMIC_414 [Oxytricha trifallax]|uniref:Uncharacterized protein n=1 Tax=Oxytricha trifallax TaxID=1172189 RepID=A0A073HYM8_9SPIT|nr:hypothetical protein OXYTRIMIC_414 [Oxytricha trifallax]
MGFPIENSGSTKRETLRTIMKSFNSCPESAQEYQENWRTNRQQQFYQTDFRPESESALQDSRTVHNQSHRQILDDEATLNITQLVSWRLSDPDQVVLSSHSANSLSMTKQHFFQYHHQSNNPVSFRFIDSKSMVVRSIKQQAGLDTMIGLSAIRELAIMSLDYLDSASTKRLQYGEFATQGGSPLSFGVDIISQQPLDQNNLRNGIEDYMKSKINTTQMLALKRRAPDYLKLLNESLTTKIMNLYMQGYQTKCIAHILGIKEKLVKKTLRKKSQHSERTTYNRNATKLNQLSDTTKQKMAEILRGSGSIITSKYIQEELKRQLGLKVSKYHIIKYLVRDLGLTYHRVYQITSNHNASISKLARQLAAAEYIRALYYSTKHRQSKLFLGPAGNYHPLNSFQENEQSIYYSCSMQQWRIAVYCEQWDHQQLDIHQFLDFIGEAPEQARPLVVNQLPDYCGQCALPQKFRSIRGSKEDGFASSLSGALLV